MRVAGVKSIIFKWQFRSEVAIFGGDSVYIVKFRERLHGVVGSGNIESLLCKVFGVPSLTAAEIQNIFDMVFSKNAHTIKRRNTWFGAEKMIIIFECIVPVILLSFNRS